MSLSLPILYPFGVIHNFVFHSNMHISQITYFYLLFDFTQHWHIYFSLQIYLLFIFNLLHTFIKLKYRSSSTCSGWRKRWITAITIFLYHTCYLQKKWIDDLRRITCIWVERRSENTPCLTQSYCNMSFWPSTQTYASIHWFLLLRNIYTSFILVCPTKIWFLWEGLVAWGTIS